MAENTPRPMTDTPQPKPGALGSKNPNPPPSTPPPRVNTAPSKGK